MYGRPYRVYIRNERCRTFGSLGAARRYAEKHVKELRIDLNTYFPAASICIGSGTTFREMSLTNKGWTDFH